MIKKSVYTKLVVQFIFFLFPFFLISGPFLPDFIITFISIWFLCFLYIKKDFSFLKNNLINLFLIFYLYININSLFSFSPEISAYTTLPYIRMILFSIGFAYFIKNIINLKRIIFYAIFSSYLILLLDSLIQIKTGYNILGYPITNNRISSFFGDKLVMGSYVARTLPILIAISYIENFKFNFFLRALLIILSGALVYFSAERTALFLFFITFCVYLLCLNNLKKIIIHISLILLVFLNLLYFKPTSADRLFKHTMTQINDKRFYLFSERHQMHFLTAYNMFLDKKFIGHGVKSFRYLCDNPIYTVKEKIINNNSQYSPISGFFYLVNYKNYKLALYIKDENIKQLEEIFLSLENDGDIEFFLKSNFIIYSKIHGKILKSVKSGSYVNKGDFVYSNSEFENGCNTHPHSSHLQVLSEIGLAGYLFFISFFIYLFLILIKTIFITIINNQMHNNNLYYIFILVGIIECLFPVIPSGNIFNNWILSILYFKIGFLFHYSVFIKNKHIKI